MNKPRGEAILKNLSYGLQEEIWQYANHTTLDKTCAWLVEKHAVKVSASTLSKFCSWYPRSYTLRRAASTSSELLETLRKMPELRVTADQAAQVAQVNFEIQAAQDRDPTLYAALRRGELERKRLELDREKFEHDRKKDWEQGLDALHEEIKGNAEALQHFERMTAALKKGVS